MPLEGHNLLLLLTNQKLIGYGFTILINLKIINTMLSDILYYLDPIYFLLLYRSHIYMGREQLIYFP